MPKDRFSLFNPTGEKALKSVNPFPLTGQLHEFERIRTQITRPDHFLYLFIKLSPCQGGVPRRGEGVCYHWWHLQTEGLWVDESLHMNQSSFDNRQSSFVN